MIYTPLTIKAMKLAYEKHAGQVDKAGMPYILHPLQVADQMDDEDETVVALLHDVLEDTDTTVSDLIRAGFTERQVDALVALDHKKDMPYMEYIKNQVFWNEIAVKVKYFDLLHNMNLNRFGGVIPPGAQERIEKKYKPAFLVISARLDTM